MPSISRIHASDKGGNASLATVTVLRAPGATTQHVDTVTHIPSTSNGFYATMGTPHSFTDPVSGETITEISEASAVDFQGHIDTGNIIIDAIAPGYTDAGSKVGDIVIIRPTTQYADNLADTMAVSMNDDGTMKSGALFAGAGALVNGVITPSIATNNLTVAIKTLAGNDPSATDPVYIRIGNTIRKISAALSVTMAAGTNWFGSGTAPYAAVERSYFVYMGYNATDGVTLGVSLMPAAKKYGDFNTTSTNSNYAKISTITNAAAADVYENVGRFNAILGVSASYNWSLPATTLSVAKTTPSFAGMFQNVKYAENTSGTTPSASGDTNFASVGCAVTFTVAETCIAFVQVGMGIISSTDFECRPEIWLDGSLYKSYNINSGAGNANSRVNERGFAYPVVLTPGAHTISAGVFLSAASSQSLGANAAFICAAVFGDVLA